MYRFNWKKSAVLAVILAAGLAISACGSKQDADTKTATASEAQSQAAEQTAAAESGAQSADAAAIEALNPVRPDSLGSIKLGQYKGITVETNAPYNVTDEDLESYLNSVVLPQYTEEVEDVQEGDTVNIDYVGTIDGKEFDGGSAKGASLTIGSGQFIEGFESGLVGAKKGDEVELHLTFPENYTEDLAGKAVVFKVTVNSISRPRLLNDALAAEIDSSVKTADEYREKVRSQLQQNANYNYDQTLAYDAVQVVVQNSEVEPSEEAVSWKTDDLIKNYYEPMMQRQYGIPLADMLSMQGQSLDQFRKSLTETARQTVQQIMVMEAIAEQEKLEVTEADREKFATDNGTTLETLRSGASDEEIDEAVLQQLATDVIIDNANIVYRSADGADASEADTSAAEE